MEEPTTIAVAGAELAADLGLPDGASGLVVFAHGSGSSRHSPRNREVAAQLWDAGLATLLLDLLTADEDAVDVRTREHRFDIDLLAGRVVAALDWAASDTSVAGLPLGLFGASTGAAAALVAAAERPELARAVVSRGGRPDLAGDALEHVRAPTLLIVGERDPQVLDLNYQAADRLAGIQQLQVVAGASHLFEEPGALETVAGLAAGWFTDYLAGDAPA